MSNRIDLCRQKQKTNQTPIDCTIKKEKKPEVVREEDWDVVAVVVIDDDVIDARFENDECDAEDLKFELVKVVVVVVDVVCDSFVDWFEVVLTMMPVELFAVDDRDRATFVPENR